MTSIICGVDVSAQTLDAGIGPGGATLRVDGSAEGIVELAAFCRQHKVGLVVMEATGGYERLPFTLLWAEGIPCALANPRSVRRFAEAMGVFEKTDRIDAGVIAWYGAVKGLVPQQPPSTTQLRLTALVRRLRQLGELIVAQTNQRRLQTDDAVITSIDAILALLRSQSRDFERAIADLISADPLWHAFDASFRDIKGVADRTVARLMAELPEIGTFNHKAITKLGGYAPFANDSGQLAGHRHVRGGRTGVRSVLFVVAEIVRRHNPDFAAFHARLTQKGKAKKVIRVALARKLLVRLNAKARDVRRQLVLAS